MSTPTSCQRLQGFLLWLHCPSIPGSVNDIVISIFMLLLLFRSLSSVGRGNPTIVLHDLLNGSANKDFDAFSEGGCKYFVLFPVAFWQGNRGSVRIGCVPFSDTVLSFLVYFSDIFSCLFLTFISALLPQPGYWQD